MMAATAPPDDPGTVAIHAGISRYYTSKLRRFGDTPRGVDWSCQATQQMRFVQLLRICDFTHSFKLDDLGCGYGALLDYLAWRHAACAVDYLGIDLSRAMISQARERFRHRPDARFVQGHASSRVADYGVASGVFNVQLDQPREAWRDSSRTLWNASTAAADAVSP